MWQSIIVSAFTALVVSIITVAVNLLKPGLIEFLLIHKNTKDIQTLLLSHEREFNLYFREGVEPKIIKFLPNGSIENVTGKDGKTNETYWEIRKGKLEILNAKRILFNRFYLCRKSRRLQSTNDTDILAGNDQRIIPRTKFYPRKDS